MKRPNRLGALTIAAGMSVTILSGLAACRAEARIISLGQARQEFKLPNFSGDERRLIIDQLNMVFSKLYVNRELKIKDFGPDHDPLVRIQKLEQDMSNLDSEAFEQRVGEIFKELHDLHTSYQAPKPYGCATTFIPLGFTSVWDQSSSSADRVIVVSGKARVLRDLTAKINLGDILQNIGGQPVAEVLGRLQNISGGANPDAMIARAVELLSIRSYGEFPSSEGDQVTLTLQGQNGVYDVTLPWSVLVDDKCLSPAEPSADTLSAGYHHDGLGQLVRSEDPFQKKYNEIFGLDSLVATTFEDAQPLPDLFEMQTIKTPAGVLGYIRLKSFDWEDESLEVGVVTETFRRELLTRIASANPVGLVIDVRGNPGGIILFAERIVQLFAPKGVEPTTVRMLANDLNQQIFVNSNGGPNRWSDGVAKALQNGAKYTSPEAITPRSEANKIGQVWFKPVVLLTDAKCYSACDLFAAGMQDNAGGTVIGIDQSTGAGGANVMQYGVFRKIMSANQGDNPFKILPHGMSLNISWRQTIRAGLNQGALIEDRGVISDVVVPLRRSDLGAESPQLMNEIRKHIEQMTPQFQSGILTDANGRIFFPNDADAKWSEKVWGVDQIVVTKDGQALASFNVEAVDHSNQANPIQVDLSLDNFKSQWNDVPMVLVGRLGGRDVFRVVRELSWRGTYTPIPSGGIKVNFANGDLGPVHVESLDGHPEKGWMVVDGTLRVGQGPNYGSRVLTRALMPLQLDGAGAQMQFDIALDAEEINDTLRLYLVDVDSGDRVDIFASSQIKPTKGVKFSLPKGLGRVDMVFEFESDENWNLEGPLLSNFIITKSQ